MQNDPSRLPDPELHLSRGSARPSLFDAVAGAGQGGRAVGLRHRDADGPLLPAADDGAARELHARVLHDPRRAGPGDVDRAPRRARHRQHLPQPDAAGEGVTALDVVSGGRAQLGIGAGWFELEHDSLGYEFGTFTDRFEKLEEALQIILPMLRDERPSLDGKHYTVNDAINQPPPVGRIPIMIGGSGEKKTLRMVAQYADESNLTSQLRRDAPQARRARRALRAARPRPLGDHGEPAPQRLHRRHPRRRRRRRRGVPRATAASTSPPWTTTSPRRHPRDRGVWGDEDEVGEKLSTIMELGADGITCSLPGNGHIPEKVEQLGRTAAKVLGL